MGDDFETVNRPVLFQVGQAAQTFIGEYGQRTVPATGGVHLQFKAEVRGPGAPEDWAWLVPVRVDQVRVVVVLISSALIALVTVIALARAMWPVRAIAVTPSIDVVPDALVAVTVMRGKASITEYGETGFPDASDDAL